MLWALLLSGSGALLDALCHWLGLLHLSILDAHLFAQPGCSRSGQHELPQRSPLVCKLLRNDKSVTFLVSML